MTSERFFRRLESVQGEFLLLLSRGQPALTDASYEERCKFFDLLPLRTRRLMISAMVCFDVLQGTIDAPNILSRLYLNCSLRRVRNQDFLRVDCHHSNYGLNEPLTSFHVLMVSRISSTLALIGRNSRTG